MFTMALSGNDPRGLLTLTPTEVGAGTHCNGTVIEISEASHLQATVHLKEKLRNPLAALPIVAPPRRVVVQTS